MRDNHRSADPPRDNQGQWDVEVLRESTNGLSNVPEDLSRQLEQSRSQVRRMASDCENLRRRSREDKERTIRFANEALLCRLLPVLDEFHAGLNHPIDDSGPGTTQVLSGLRMVLNHLEEILASQGLQRLDPMGTVFDPTQHEAVRVKDDPHQGPGTVLETLRFGYLYHGRLLRAAQVVIVPLNNHGRPPEMPIQDEEEKGINRSEIQNEAAHGDSPVSREGESLGAQVIIEEDLLQELEAMSLGDAIPEE